MKQSHLADASGLIFQKQAQVQALWAVYTAVQFATAGFAMSEFHQGSQEWMPRLIGFAVLGGVWAFNMGHLSMILGCLSQSQAIKVELPRSPFITADERAGIIRIINADTFGSKHQSETKLWQLFAISIFVHLFIDLCASVALMSRVEGFDWLRHLLP